MRASLLALALIAACPTLGHARSRAHNLVLFVADGLRPGVVGPETAPAMADLLRSGVRFANSHSLFPTFTMPNASTLGLRRDAAAE